MPASLQRLIHINSVQKKSAWLSDLARRSNPEGGSHEQLRNARRQFNDLYLIGFWGFKDHVP
jgi:hypothetical protein